MNKRSYWWEFLAWVLIGFIVTMLFITCVSRIYDIHQIGAWK